jgi:flagellar protein FliO/FliZ
MFARLIVSLGVVIGLMWVAANVMRKRGLAPGSSRRNMRGVEVELLARKPLGRNASVAVIRVGERSMVIGVTDHYVTKLDDADVMEIDLEDGANWTAPPSGPPNPGPSSAWKMMLDQMRARTARR